MFVKHLYSFKMPPELILSGVFLNQLGKWGNRHDFSTGLQNYHRFELNGYKEYKEFQKNARNKLYNKGAKDIYYMTYLCKDNGEEIREFREFWEYNNKGQVLNQQGKIIKLK